MSLIIPLGADGSAINDIVEIRSKGKFILITDITAFVIGTFIPSDRRNSVIPAINTNV